MEKMGIPFVIVPSPYEEDNNLYKDPSLLVQALSLGKAQAVTQDYPTDIVIGADTIVYADKILGKPKSREDAKSILRHLSGTTHSVFTGVSMVQISSEKTFQKVVESKVTFHHITDADIERYISNEDVMGYAWAYAIQNRAMMFVEKIDGDLSAVIGLPMAVVKNMLQEFS